MLNLDAPWDANTCKRHSLLIAEQYGLYSSEFAEKQQAPYAEGGWYGCVNLDV